MIILTIAEIKDLAEFCGLVISPPSELDEDQNDTEICITPCPKEGLKDEDGKIYYSKNIAYFYEYPEEGSIPLGRTATHGEEVDLSTHPDPRIPIAKELGWTDVHLVYDDQYGGLYLGGINPAGKWQEVPKEIKPTTLVNLQEPPK